jgi:tetratricopeptide (TPR) repeat protein
MKRTLSAFVLMLGALAAAQGVAPASRNLSPAETEIADARKTILEKPTQYAGYNHLATALLSRARETSDASYYAEASAAVKKSFELVPDNFDTRKIQVSILLGEHEFPAALTASIALNKKVPDDVMVYGLLTDANVGLGNYNEAENSAQWMLNLLPGNVPALTRAGNLRELFGDAEGAYELMDLASQSTPETETGERAWILTQMGHLRLVSGDTEAAGKLLQQALTAFPGYPGALEGLAHVRIAQKRYEDAVALLQRREESTSEAAAHRASNLYQLAEALQLAGHTGEAQKAFEEFEGRALEASARKDNSNGELIFYYADHAHQPAKALKIAQQEYSWRRDVYTLDAYAWALHVTGQDAEARKQIEIGIAVGVRDSKLFLHAGEIALTLGDVSAVKVYEKQLAELHSAESEEAQSMLASLTSTPGRR